MEKNDLSKSFMEKALDADAWKKLSSQFEWNQELIEKCKSSICWKEISNNCNILWTTSMLEKFRGNIDWRILSSTHIEHLFSQYNLEKFEEYWNWKELSKNSEIEFTFDLIDRFIDNWDWQGLINNRSLYNLGLYDEEFLNKYSNFIPADKLESSYLWDGIVESRKKKLLHEILSGDLKNLPIKKPGGLGLILDNL